MREESLLPLLLSVKVFRALQIGEKNEYLLFAVSVTSEEGPSLQSASELIKYSCLDGNVRRNIESLHGNALFVSRRVWRLATSEMVAGDWATRLHFPTARRREVGKLRKSDIKSPTNAISYPMTFPPE